MKNLLIVILLFCSQLSIGQLKIDIYAGIGMTSTISSFVNFNASNGFGTLGITARFNDGDGLFLGLRTDFTQSRLKHLKPHPDVASWKDWGQFMYYNSIVDYIGISIPLIADHLYWGLMAEGVITTPQLAGGGAFMSFTVFKKITLMGYGMYQPFQPANNKYIVLVAMYNFL